MLKILSDTYLMKFHFRNAELECSLLPSPGGMDSDMSCLNRRLIFFFFLLFFNHLVLLPNTTEVMGSLVTFDGCALEELGFGICGGDLKGRFQEVERYLSSHLPYI